jgi:hypothetical protein
MTDEIKICHSCKHFKRDGFAAFFGFGDSKDLWAKCYAPELMSVDPVSGKPEPRTASIARTYDHSCGPKGRLWEAA